MKQWSASDICLQEEKKLGSSPARWESRKAKGWIRPERNTGVAGDEWERGGESGESAKKESE
jgi:hypothetical protein